MSEKEFMGQVIRLAKLWHWLVYHTHDSRRSQAGFPDLVLCKPPRMLYVELKSDKGKVRPEQLEWIERLGLCGCDVRVWRPSDWAEIEQTLMGGT